MSSELSMTPGEIVISFRQAKDKKQQITILSHLNLCTTHEIIEILKAGGVDSKLLPKSAKKKTVTDKRC